MVNDLERSVTGGSAMVRRPSPLTRRGKAIRADIEEAESIQRQGALDQLRVEQQTRQAEMKVRSAAYVGEVAQAAAYSVSKNRDRIVEAEGESLTSMDADQVAQVIQAEIIKTLVHGIESVRRS